MTQRVTRHHNLRVSYVAQHSMHHLESSLELTPIEYLQRRFYEGRDKEQAKMITMSLTDEEKEMTEQRGEICEILSRVTRQGKLFYEIEVAGRKKRENKRNQRPGREEHREFRSLQQLEALQKPHVMKLVRMFDERMNAESSGMAMRPITVVEVSAHLADFGVDAELARRKIKLLSGGQRCRIVIAAAFWSRPHLVAMDEPSNFLDAESLAVLTHSLRTFKGAVLVITHEQAFVKALANEIWHVGGGDVRVELTAKGQKIKSAKGA